MHALVPHKDTLFLLSQVQRSFISQYNTMLTQNTSEPFAYPQFPLWCLYDDSLSSFEHDIASCTIESPAYENNEFYFPVHIFCNAPSNEQSTSLQKITLRIVFAKTDAAIKKAPDFSLVEKSDAFPLRQRVFRVGTATVENNGWSLSDDRWVKLS